MDMFEKATKFVRSYADGVLHPLSPADSKNGNTSQDNAAQAGHLAGQFTDFAVASLIAHKLPFLKSARAVLPELEIQGSKFADKGLLLAPKTLIPREATVAESLKSKVSSFAGIHMTPETYSLMGNASHLIESTHIETTTYLMSKSVDSTEVFEKTMPFKFYKLKGMETKIGMPVDFADSLERIRSARLRSSHLDGFERDRFDESKASKLNGYDSMILPEQMPLFLRELPNPSLVKELLLIPEADLRAGAAVDLENRGRVQMFDHKKYLDSYIDTAEAPFYLRHEWSHLSERENESLSNAFGVARRFEEDGFFAHDTAVDSAAEDWAVHLGEHLMDPDSTKFLETVEKAPLRSLVLLQSLKQELAKGEQIMKESMEGGDSYSVFVNHMRNPYQAQLQARVEMGEKLLLPEVRSFLRKQIGHKFSANGIEAHRYVTIMRENGLELMSSD